MKKEVLEDKKILSAEAQSRCIWMTAGVVSFKLCPLSYECEHCDFDKVMQHQYKNKDLVMSKPRAGRHPILASETKESEPFFTFSPHQFPAELHLYLAHLWAKPLDGNRWKIGIDELLAYILPRPLKIELCEAKKSVIQNETFGEILTEVETLFLTAPLSGTLLLENPALKENPGLLQDDPMGAGWLAEIEWYQDSSELDRFYTGSQATKFLQEEAQHIKHFLKYRGIKTEEIGKTLPDGGVHIKHLHQILPEEICLKLARQLIVLGKAIW
ncbi:MAG: glycine cleavage system protein H [candidate division Zixibacteria bacterium]|nr:glycine cleavage system protein H [candidate division Zixibacteria bacterium]